MSRVTQRQVVETALAQLTKRGGYTPKNYFARSASWDGGVNCPGPEVGACCAIGGVEQAIWKLTGDDVSSWRSYLAMKVLRRKPKRGSREALYAGVMQKLNAKARKLYPTIGGTEIGTVEDITFQFQARSSRPRVIHVFESVLEDLS